jgi:threonine/homoserine/homoserine lactone efflux protein
MNSGMHYGIKKSMPHYMGICLGFPVMLLIVALGFGAIFTKYLWIKEILKIIGSLYMLYLAWQVIKSSIADSNGQQVGKPFSFTQAVLFQWVNPKAWLMAVGAISIFSLTANYFSNAIALSTLFFLVLIPCLAVWLVFGAVLQKILTDKKHQKIFNSVMALCLVASIALIFID